MKNKRVLSLRTKAEVILVSLFLIGISALGVMSVTRTITDSSDNVDTFIRNSNGNYWSATGANIQLAIDDLTSGGTVELPSGTYATTEATITMGNSVNIIGSGMNQTVINAPTTGIDVIKMGSNCSVKNIKIVGSRDIASHLSVNGANCVLENIFIDGGGEYGAIDINSNDITLKNIYVSNIVDTSNAYASAIHIGESTVYNVYVDGFKIWNCDRAVEVEDLAHNVVVKNGYIDNVTGGVSPLLSFGAHGHAAIGYAYDITFENIHLNNSRGFIAEMDCRNVIFDKIYVENLKSVCFIQHESHVIKNSFFNGLNSFTDSYMVMMGTTAGAGGGVVRDCYFDNVSGWYGIQVNNADYALIDGCTIVANRSGEANAANYGVRVSNGCRYLIISNCWFLGDFDSNYALYLDDAVIGGLIDNNNIDTDGVYIDDLVQNVTFTHNYIEGNLYDSPGARVYLVHNDLRGTNINGLLANSIIKDNIGYDYDSLQDDYIWNSDGHYYPDTEAGLILAFSEAVTGDKITLPLCNISITTSLLVPSGVWLDGQGDGSILYLADSANCSIIKNEGWQDFTAYGTAGDVVDIKISNILIDGNQYNQPRSLDSGDHANNIHAINLCNSNRTVISDVTFKDVAWSAIFMYMSNDIEITGCHFYDIGTSYWDWWDKPDDLIMRGCLFVNCKNMSVLDCVFDEIHGGAVGIEPSSAFDCISENFIIDSCRISNCYFGIWLEGHAVGIRSVQNGVISNCILQDITKYENCYNTGVGKMRGIGINRYVENVTVTGCSIHRAGNITNDIGGGIELSGRYNIVDGCTFTEIYGYGIRVEKSNNIVSNNIIREATDIGIYVRTDDTTNVDMQPVVTGNEIINSHNVGIKVDGASSAYLSKNKGGTISNNVIRSSYQDANDHGIWIRLWNITVTGNTIEGCKNGIYNDAQFCIYSNNIIMNPAHHGIFLGGSEGNVTLTGNIISGCGAYAGINVGGYYHCCIMIGNRMTDCGIGIDESTTDVDFNIYVGNMATDCTNGFDFNGANNNITANMGTHT